MITLERQDGGVAAQEQTDSQGRFFFGGLVRTSYRVSVRLQGYEPNEENVDLHTTSHAYLQINLRAIPTSKTVAVPPEGAASQVSARDLNIPAAAVIEFEKGKKLLLEDKDASKSVPHFLKAIKVYAKFPQAHVLLGVAYLHQGKVPEAEQSLKKAIQVDDMASDAYIALGALQNQEKKFADAEKTLSKAVELKPDSFQAQYELGKSYWALQRNDEADPHAQKALALDSNSAEAHVLMGNVLLRKRDGAGALREYKESLRLSPNGPMAEPTRQMVTKLETALKEQSK
jgi:tetratricopeptide (TPR) repeat protein